MLDDNGRLVQIDDSDAEASARHRSGGTNALANGLYAWNGAVIEAGDGKIDVTARKDVCAPTGCIPPQTTECV